MQRKPFGSDLYRQVRAVRLDGNTLRYPVTANSKDGITIGEDIDWIGKPTPRTGPGLLSRLLGRLRRRSG
ncbi:hypothetical protein [Nocardioides daejeonensis]|uniref:hypothetical protein n=1 Tax=Nocardioides daejeonensis TaxID=1046556 RepID=UPI000D74A85C|nr:hypothetical protein [Nocardioides daejeonensis]